MPNSNDPKKVLIKYRYPDQYNPPFISGAWGGLTPAGELCVHFFFERAPLPHSETFEIQNNQLGGQLGKQPEEANVDGVMLRMVVGGIVMTPVTARALITFLESKIRELETLQDAAAKAKH